MSLYAPPKILIENYMIEIAKAYNVPFVPDLAVMEVNRTVLFIIFIKEILSLEFIHVFVRCL